MSKLVEIGHDGFARQSVIRECIEGGIKGCHWCGSKRKTGRLFQYSVKSDDDIIGSRTNPIKGLFCSRECMNNYHG